MEIRDRITELRRVKASEILPNPANWRTHPQEQQDAIKGILAEVGIADALLVRETPDGLQLLDGHLRADCSPDTIWPVLVLDVNDSEAAKLLATFDPLAAMAGVDTVKLDALLREVDTGSEALQQMLSQLAEDAGMYDGDVVENPDDEWVGMPEYDGSAESCRTVIVHFLEQADVDKFAEMAGSAIGEKTKSIWFPKRDTQST